MRHVIRQILFLVPLAIAACDRSRPPLSSFSGDIGNGYNVVGFGFSEDWQGSNVGDLVYLFVFEQEPSPPRGSTETLTSSSSVYHDASIIRNGMSFSRTGPDGNVIEQRSVDLVIDRKDDSFQVGELKGGPTPGRVVLVGRNDAGKLVIKRQSPPPGPIRLHVDGAKALLEGSLGNSLGIRK